jgi:hypothetical protein
MAKIFNLARMTVSGTPGTGNITLNAAVSGLLTFAQAGVVDGDVIEYAIKDSAHSEKGIGAYSSTGPTLTRNLVLSSTNGGSAINCTSAAEVCIDESAEYLRTVASALHLLCGGL